MISAKDARSASLTNALTAEGNITLDKVEMSIRNAIANRKLHVVYSFKGVSNNDILNIQDYLRNLGYQTTSSWDIKNDCRKLEIEW